MKKSLALFLAAALVLACGCGGAKDPTKGTQKASDRTEIHTEAQAKYLAGSYDKIDRYADGKKELSRPESIVLDFSDQKLKGDRFFVQVSTESNMSEFELYETSEQSLPITNLLLDTTYYWRAAVTEAGLNDAKLSQFTTTAAGPRNLFVEGVTNVRDLGGYKAGDRRVKQGMLYRGGRLNADSKETPVAEITEAGMRVFTETMKVRTELDLRRASNNETGGLTESLAPGVRYVNVEMDSGGGPEGNKAQIREIFALLADENSYPVYFHCSIGTDRTGLVSYLVLGFLGVAEEDIYRDYLFSNFGEIGSARLFNTLEASVIGKIDKYEGASLSEKAANYLKSCGVTEEELSKVRSILLAP